MAGRRIDESVFRPLVRSNVEWISQTPFGWMKSADSTQIQIVTEGDIYWGETDRGLAETALLARSFGIRTLLKPHLWVAGWHDTVWTGEIKMKSDDHWKAWFDSYRSFILHYANLAEKNGMEALAVGTELQGATLGHEKEWREIIRQVRAVYHGKLTYAANWDHEFEAIPFWDALDFTGVQAYFPLSQKSDPTLEELMAGWAQPLAMLERVASRTHRSVVFTEVGYKSSDRASVQPWLWDTQDRVNPQQQARCYEAMFRSTWRKPWFKGAYIWKWYPHYDTSRSGDDNNFTPQGKPAEQTLSLWYSSREVPAEGAASRP
ncbi:MAG: glycoside hydrolase TIM-barrel-like domain-containing protein [Acidobacteria bacterium]|nr:glycoside hydrolase TIM-barrel-like domain-containing protein [Acidobacteriota bacterium]